MFTLTQVAGVVASNSIKANPSSSEGKIPPKQLGNEVIETISDATGKAMDAGEEIINQTENNNEPEKDTKEN